MKLKERITHLESEIENLREDVELLKYGSQTIPLRMVIKFFQNGRYDKGDKRALKESYKDMKLLAKKLGLI